MSVAKNLTPDAIPVVDYDIAQGPVLGGEREVKLSAEPFLMLGIARLTADATVAYEFINPQLSKVLTGTVSKTATSAVVTGVGTKFTKQVKVGDRIQIPGTAIETKFVQSIATDTSLTCTANFDNTAAGQTATLVPICPIIAFVMNELKADEAVAVTFGDLTATFTPASYAKNQSFNFAACRAIELIGPGVDLIGATDVPTITNAKRGAIIGFAQVPRLSDFVEVGSTTTKDITPPTKTSKLVSDGLDTNRYSKTGRTMEASLRISARDLGPDDGLNRFFGVKCCAMIETWKEEKILTDRQLMINFTPGASKTNPDADGESGDDAQGGFQYMCVLVAPGA